MSKENNFFSSLSDDNSDDDKNSDSKNNSDGTFNSSDDFYFYKKLFTDKYKKKEKKWRKKFEKEIQKAVKKSNKKREKSRNSNSNIKDKLIAVLGRVVEKVACFSIGRFIDRRFDSSQYLPLPNDSSDDDYIYTTFAPKKPKTPGRRGRPKGKGKK